MGTDNVIHPTALVGPEVVLGSGNRIDANVVITGPVTIGDNNWICSGVVLGAVPEIRALRPDADGNMDVTHKGLVIGNGNVFRENAQVHQGHNRATVIGNDVYIMNQVYVAHDGRIDDGATLASSVLLAGNIHVATKANIGMGAVVHQGLSIGALTMVGMGAIITKPVPHFTKTYGTPAAVHGTNEVGLSRNGVDQSTIDDIVARNARGEYLSDDEVAALLNPGSAH